MPNYSPGALRALYKNALEVERGPSRVSPLRRQASRAAPPPEIPADVREAHDDELAEREAVYVYAGLPEYCGSRLIDAGCCAAHAALQDVGCVEFYSYEPGAPSSVRVRESPRAEIVYPGIRAMLLKWAAMGRRERIDSVDEAVRECEQAATRTLLCSRCESIGHLVEACPFAVTDTDVLRIAAARRARRRGRAA